MKGGRNGVKKGGRMWFKKTGKTSGHDSGEPKGQRNLWKVDCTNLGKHVRPPGLNLGCLCDKK